MGLFDSSYEYYAYAGSSQLFDDDPVEGSAYPNTIKSMILQAATSPVVEIADGLLTGINASFTARANKFHTYGAEHYTYGLPNSYQEKYIIDSQLVVDTIEFDEGITIDHTYSISLGPFEELIFLNSHVKDAYEFDPSRFDWINGPPPVVTWDELDALMYIPVWDSVNLQYYQTNNTPVYVRVIIPGEPIDDIPDEVTDWYEVYIEYIDNVGATQQWRMPTGFYMGPYVEERFYHVRFEDVTKLDKVQYWFYKLGSNVYPELEAAADPIIVQNSFLPVVVVMRDKIWVQDDERTGLYETTEKILKKLTIDVDELKTDFEKQEAEDNATGEPDKANAEKWDFLIHFGCPVHSNYRGSKEYVLEFFRYMLLNQQHTFSEYQTFLASWNGTKYKLPQPIEETNITAGGLNGYNADYRWSYIEEVTFPGTFIDENSDSLELKDMHSIMYERTSTNATAYKVGIEQIHGVGTPIGEYGQNAFKKGYHDYVIFTRQDELSHTRILIMGLSMRYRINTRISAQDGYRWRYAIPTLFGDAEEKDEFVIPIHKAAIDNVSFMYREEALADSLHGTVFLVERVKVKWYQQTFFKWLIVIIAVIVIILTYQYELLPALSLLAAGLAGGSAFVFWSVYVVLQFAVGILISTAGSIIGGEAGLAFTIIAMVLMAGGIKAFTSKLTIAWTNVKASAGWGTAMSFIQAVQPYLQTTFNIYENRALAALDAEMRDFIKSAKEKQEELDDAWAGLSSPSWLDPMDLVANFNGYFAESPDAFLSRSLNANPGVTANQQVYHFVEMALALPENVNEADFVTLEMDDFKQQRGA